MKIITYHIGAPCSPARFKQAKRENGRPVCPNCIKKHSTDKTDIIISIGMEECFVCENGAENCFLFLN